MKKTMLLIAVILACVSMTITPGYADWIPNEFTLINGDCNGDNMVDEGDFGLLSTAWYSSFGDPNYDERADLNGDGWVDESDFGILGDSWYLFGDDEL